MSIQNIKKIKVKLQILNTLKKVDPLNNQNQKILLLKFLHILFLKNTLTSKSTNRIVEQFFKKCSSEYKESGQTNYASPAALDETYQKSFFLNSLYQLLHLSN